MLVEKVLHYRIGTGGDSTQTVSGFELVALALWLVNAFHDKNVSPLVLRGAAFCWRDGYVIKFLGQDEAMSMDTLIQLLQDIEDTARLDPPMIAGMWPVVSDWHKTSLSTSRGARVEVINGLLNYYDKYDEAILPAALRHSEDGDFWYAIKSTDEYEGQELFVTRYRFDNLSSGQL